MKDLIKRTIAALLAIMIAICGMGVAPGAAWAANVDAGFQFIQGTGSIGCTKFGDNVEVNVAGLMDDFFITQPILENNVFIDSARFYGMLDGLSRDITPENGTMKNTISGTFAEIDPNGIFGFTNKYASGFTGREFAKSGAPVVTGRYNGFILLKRDGKVFAKPNIAVSTSTVVSKFLTFTCGNRDEDGLYQKNTSIQDMPRVIVKQIGRVVSSPETIQQMLREIQKQSVKVRVRVR
jgi:hypothetical protein